MSRGPPGKDPFCTTLNFVATSPGSDEDKCEDDRGVRMVANIFAIRAGLAYPIEALAVLRFANLHNPQIG